MSANREYKSSVFSTLFGEPDKFLELYNALSDSNYPIDTPMIPATLTDVLFMDRQNDVAFIIGDTIVVLIEHQASINENMPLRLLIYIARVYELIVDNRAMYKEKLLRIPKPEFIVFYNGTDNFPNEKELSLTNAFVEAPKAGLGGLLELKVRVVNINKGFNQAIINSSANLSGYVEFITLVRQYQKAGQNLTDAMTRAVTDCINRGILADFLSKHSSEVINMLITEFDINVAKEVWQEEAQEEGLKKGLEKAKLSVAEEMLNDNLPLIKIIQYTGLTQEQIENLKPTTIKQSEETDNHCVAIGDTIKLEAYSRGVPAEDGIEAI